LLCGIIVWQKMRMIISTDGLNRYDSIGVYFGCVAGLAAFIGTLLGCVFAFGWLLGGVIGFLVGSIAAVFVSMIVAKLWPIAAVYVLIVGAAAAYVVAQHFGVVSF